MKQLKDSSLYLTKSKCGDLVRLAHISRPELIYVGIVLGARQARFKHIMLIGSVNYLVHISEGSFTFF